MRACVYVCVRVWMGVFVDGWVVCVCVYASGCVYNTRLTLLTAGISNLKKNRDTQLEVDALGVITYNHFSWVF